MITLLNTIFANPIAYLIFPNMVNTHNTSTTTEYAVYSGYLNLYKDNKLVKLFTGTSTIDLSDVSGRIRFDNVTDTYSAVVGEWDLAKSLDLIMEDNIKQAMVLWYDLKRQGATNESMAANPTLRDLSGNGHDATCYNFAWTEESGISTTNYPNALVSDGVDDYCLVEGLPLLNKEDGYTVIAKRKILTDFSTSKRAVGFLSKRSKNAYGAFVIEKRATSVNMETVYSFSSTYNDVNIDEEEHIVVTTKNSYDGQHITSGTSNDNDFLLISVGYNNDGTIQEHIESVIYSLLLFNRDLSADEIEWVKTNLIETEQ